MLQIFRQRCSCWLAVMAVAMLSSLGCSICCTPHYDMYPAYGGAWERTNRTHGRVGSVIEPAGGRVVAAPQDMMEAVPETTEPEPEEIPDPTRQPIPPFPEEFRPAEPAPPLEARNILRAPR